MAQAAEAEARRSLNALKATLQQRRQAAAQQPGKCALMTPADWAAMGSPGALQQVPAHWPTHPLFGTRLAENFIGRTLIGHNFERHHSAAMFNFADSLM